MKYVLDGYCGLYCGACPVMLETQAGREANPCFGCKSELPAGHCATCGIKQCAREHGYDFCYECAEVEDCERMRQFIADEKWPYHRGVTKNFEAIQQVGKASWLEGQAGRWQCTKCGKSHSWWDEKCSKCDEAVASYQVDL